MCEVGFRFRAHHYLVFISIRFRTDHIDFLFLFDL